MSEDKSIAHSEVELAAQIELDPVFKDRVERLYRLIVYGRWLVICLLWATVGAYSIYELRYPLELIREDFTWAAVKYGLIFQPISAVGLAVCVGMTIGTLIWQSRNAIWGLPKDERERLVKQVCQICKQGSSHPFWKWVVKE
jgi:hypothetical protein